MNTSVCTLGKRLPDGPLGPFRAKAHRYHFTFTRFFPELKRFFHSICITLVGNEIDIILNYPELIIGNSQWRIATGDLLD